MQMLEPDLNVAEYQDCAGCWDSDSSISPSTKH